MARSWPAPDGDEVSLLDVVCPALCSGCGLPGRVACDRCRLALAAVPVRHRPTPCPPALPPTWVIARYDGPVRNLLLGYKERGVASLGGLLGDALARAVAAAADPSGPLLVVAIPSSRAAVRRRGDDVVRLLALRAARRLRGEGRRLRVVPALVQQRRLADSAGLSAPARAANIAGAFAVRESVAAAMRGATVLLVDDLVTTGTTLSEAAVALRRGGATVVGAAAVAATSRQALW